MEFLDNLMKPGSIWVLIPLVAIIMSIGKSMLNRYFEHQERMAEIEAGIASDDRD